MNGAPSRIEVIKALEPRIPGGCRAGAAPVSALAISPDGKWIATGFRDHVPWVMLWSTETGAPGMSFPIGLDDEFGELDPEAEREARAELIAEHDATFFAFYAVAQIAFSPDGALVAVQSMNHDNGNQFGVRVEVFEVATGRRTARIEGDADRDWTEVFGVACFAWRPASREIVVATFGGAVERWDVQRGRRIRTVRRRGPRERLVQVAVVGVDASGERVAWVQDSTLEVRHGREAARYELPATFRAGAAPGKLVIDGEGVTFAAISPKGGVLARPLLGLHHADPEVTWIASLHEDGSAVWGGEQRKTSTWQGKHLNTSVDAAWRPERVAAAAEAGGLFAWTDGLNVFNDRSS